jgi:cobalt-zinc-cadmium efflux system outer membrane protein
VEAHQAQADVDLVRLDLVFHVTEAFYAVLLAREHLKYVQEDAALASTFLEQTRLKHDVGDVARVEVLRAQLETSQAESAVGLARSALELARAKLNFLLARPQGSPLELIGTLNPAPASIDLPTLQARALASRPELRTMRLAAARDEQLRRQASLGYFPDIELGVARHHLVGEPTSWDVTVALPIPLYFWQPRKGDIAEAIASASATEREAEHVRSTILLEVEEASRELLTARDQIRRFETGILKEADESYQMFAFSYAEGEIGGLELIAARRSLLQVRAAYAQALYDGSVAAAALARAVGQ